MYSILVVLSEGVSERAYEALVEEFGIDHEAPLGSTARALYDCDATDGEYYLPEGYLDDL